MRKCFRLASEITFFVSVSLSNGHWSITNLTEQSYTLEMNFTTSLVINESNYSISNLEMYFKTSVFTEMILTDHILTDA